MAFVSAMLALHARQGSGLRAGSAAGASVGNMAQGVALPHPWGAVVHVRSPATAVTRK